MTFEKNSNGWLVFLKYDDIHGKWYFWQKIILRWQNHITVVFSGRWFSPVSSTNKTDRYDITDILLKVALKTISRWYDTYIIDLHLLTKQNDLCHSGSVSFTSITKIYMCVLMIKPPLARFPMTYQRPGRGVHKSICYNWWEFYPQ